MLNFSHLLQHLLTADGNFHANHYAKILDNWRDPWLNGRACFPDDNEFRMHMVDVTRKDSGANVEVCRQILGQSRTTNTECLFITQKSTCAFLKAVNRQDKLKFAGMDVSGIVNIQCPHVMILAGVDLHKGEK